MNLPNKITVARFALTMVFVATLSIDFSLSKSCALILFIVASITDFLDGYIARKFNLVTKFGKLMDPLVDKILVSAAFVLLTANGYIPAWMVVVILSREFLVTGLRLIASSEGHVLAAEKLGKHKTTWQIITVIYFLTYLASTESAFNWIAPAFALDFLSPGFAGEILLWITLLLTVISGVGYVTKNIALLREDV